MIALLWLAIAGAQEIPRAPEASVTAPDSLVARARTVSPRLRAARERVRAAEARVRPAGARPDPMLMAGIRNFPVSEPGFRDFMTMKMLGVSQTIPAPGKLAASRRAAGHEVEVARAELDAVTLGVTREVLAAYYDVAYVDHALAIVERTRDVLVGLIQSTQARYAAGTAGQQDVLRARLEVTRLGEASSALREERRAVVARLNALLDQPTEASFSGASIPSRIARAAVASAPADIQFESPLLGSRSAGSPLPPLDKLQAMAMRLNPDIRAHEAAIGAQASRAELARLDRRPDVDVSLEYGQRDRFSDMVSVVVSLPLQLQRTSKQDPLVAAARSELLALQAQHHQMVNQVRSDIARLSAQIERNRTELALTVKAVLPQSRATLQAAVANYQAGRAEFVAVLDAHAELFNSETNYFRALTEFAKTLAELEQTVGGEVLP